MLESLPTWNLWHHAFAEEFHPCDILLPRLDATGLLLQIVYHVFSVNPLHRTHASVSSARILPPNVNFLLPGRV